MAGPPIPAAFHRCIFWISQFIYFTFLALGPLSMPIQYLFKHYFMPLARETFTFKFSNIPQSLVCKQHRSVLQLLPLSEAVGIKPSHARRGWRSGGPRGLGPGLQRYKARARSRCSWSTVPGQRADSGVHKRPSRLLANSVDCSRIQTLRPADAGS